MIEIMFWFIDTMANTPYGAMFMGFGYLLSTAVVMRLTDV